MKKTLILSCALALAGLSSAASAAEGGAGFIRGEIGRSDIELEFEGVRDSDKDTSAVFAGGYWFNANIGVEGHIGVLYNQQVDDVDTDLVTLGLALAAKKNFGADGRGFFIGGRAGIARLTAQVREDEFTLIDDDSSTKPFFGVNVGYDFSERFGLGLNFDRRRAGFDDGIDVDVDTISLGGEFRF